MICTSKGFKRVSSLPNSYVPKIKNINSGLKIGKILYGFILVFSLFLANSVLSGFGQPFVNVHEASAQLGPTTPLFGNPGTLDFLSLAVAIVPTIQGADLNISKVAGSTNCDLLVPVTYLDGGCMSSLPLLTPFTAQPNMTVPTNETAFVDYNYSQPSSLAISIGLSSDNITAGETQTVSVTVTDENSTEPISGAHIYSNITDSYGTDQSSYDNGTTDDTGQTSFDYAIPADALSDYYTVTVTASADGYDDHTETTTFEVIGSDYDSLYDNSTFDDSSNYDDGNYNYDDGSSSSDNNNDDFDSPTVKSVDPQDNDNNVPTNTEIKVTFDEKMDQNTLDDGSLDIFCVTTCDIDNVGVNANPSSKSVTYKLDRQLEPGTEYEAQLDFNIEDDNGNFLDCSNSNDVDSSCSWRFETTGNGNANIELTPTSGPFGSSVHITGTGFNPNHDITVTFTNLDIHVVATSSTDNNGEFSDDFIVPLSLPGPHTVAASDGSNSDSATFNVTSAPPAVPIIGLNNTIGPVDTPVNIIGINFDHDSEVIITFDGKPVDTITSPVTTNSTGGFSAVFKVPASTVGLKTVAATDEGLHSDTTLFEVTDTNPPLALSTANQQLSNSISNFSLTETENLSNQSDLSNVTNAPLQNESNITISTPYDTTPKPPLDESNETYTSSPSESTIPSESTTPSESSQDMSDITRNNTQTVKTIVIPDNEDTSKLSPEVSAKQLTENQSSITNTRSDSESSDNTKESSDNAKISKEDLLQDRKDRQLFEKYLRGDHAESKQEENSKPVAANDEAKTIQDSPVTIAILSNDKDPDGDKLKIMGVSPPQKGKIETNGDGSIVYSPEKSWAGKEVFSYTVGDGNGGIATASVQVEVQPASINNHEPRALDQTISGNENTPEKIELKAKDPDDGDKLAFKIVEQPSHGKIAEFSSEKGTLVYLPDKDYQGKDGLNFIVSDGMAESKEGKITIDVKPGRNFQEEQQQADQSQQQQQKQEEQKQQDESSKSDDKQSSSADDSSNGDKPKSDDSKADQSEDQKQQEQKQEEPKEEQKQEEPKEEQKSSDSGNDSGS